MRILHLTDLHYSNKIGGRTKQKKLLENFFVDIEENVSDIDYVIFSGDLVNDGSKISDFKKAKEEFLDKILVSLKISKNDLFICQGAKNGYSIPPTAD